MNLKIASMASIATVMTMALSTPGYCFNQPGAREIAQQHNAEERLFIQRLQSPHGYSCCNESDCHATDEDIRNGHYWARIGRVTAGEWDLLDWVQIPDENVLKKGDLPDQGKHPGHPIICEKNSKIMEPDKPLSSLTIYCFIPGVGM